MCAKFCENYTKTAKGGVAIWKKFDDADIQTSNTDTLLGL